MRIQQILNERSFQHASTMYHGTSTTFLRGILKNGLLANPPQKSWTGVTNNLPSLDGVYVTSKVNYAKEAADAAVEKHGGDPLIVVVQTVVTSGTPDEDIIIRPIIERAYEAYKNDFKGYHTDYFNDIINTLDNRVKLSQASAEKIKQYVDTVIKILQDENYRKTAGSFYASSDLRTRPELQQLIRPLLSTMKPKEEDNKRFEARLTRDIGYKGKTRIVKIWDGKTEQVYYTDPGLE